MKIQELRDYAHRLAGLMPSDKYPVLTPRQLHPDGVGGLHEEEFYKKLGEYTVHFLNSRKKFK